MRFAKFLLEENEIPISPDFKTDGIHSVLHEITEIEIAKNAAQADSLYVLFEALCELFEMKNVEMQISVYSVSFLLIEREESAIDSQKGKESPVLSRKKLKEAKSAEIASAIIDVLLTRDEWGAQTYYRSIRI